MPWSRPTLSELVTRTRADFRSRLGISGALVRRAMADVLAVVWAGTVHLTHGQLEWIVDQLFGTTAERYFLLRLAARYGITPTPATFASGIVTAVGAGLNPIPENTVLVRDDGATYKTTALAIISGSGSVAVQAVTAGADSNLEEGESLSFESPVTGIDSAVTVGVSGIAGGLEEEGTEELRARYLLRRREPPSGGGDQDYKAWALAVAGVTRVWPRRHVDGLGTVRVWFVMDGEEDIFPTTEKIAEVQSSVDEQRPLTAEPTAASPINLAVDFALSLANDSTANQAAVKAELKDLFFRVAEPGDNDSLGVVLISEMRTAIGNTAGGDYTLTAPSGNIVPNVGELVTLGEVAFS